MWTRVTINTMNISIAENLRFPPKCFSAVCKSISKKKRKLLLDGQVVNILLQ